MKKQFVPADDPSLGRHDHAGLAFDHRGQHRHQGWSAGIVEGARHHGPALRPGGAGRDSGAIGQFTKARCLLERQTPFSPLVGGIQAVVDGLPDFRLPLPFRKGGVQGFGEKDHDRIAFNASLRFILAGACFIDSS